jgi:hypothetical protein
MKRYIHIAFAAILGLAYAGIRAEDDRLTLDQMQQMNPNITFSVPQTTIGANDIATADQVARIKNVLNTNLSGYTRDELVRWYGQGDNLLTELLRMGGKNQDGTPKLMGTYRQYKQEFQDKFNERNGKLPGGKRAGQAANQPTSASPVRARNNR